MSLIKAFNVGIVAEKKPAKILQNNKLRIEVQSPRPIDDKATPDIVIANEFFLPILSDNDDQTKAPKVPVILNRPSCRPT